MYFSRSCVTLGLILCQSLSRGASAAAASGSVCPPFPASFAGFTDVVTFGASYVDNGSHNAATYLSPMNVLMNDPLGTAQAGTRNSNGPLFPELLVAPYPYSTPFPSSGPLSCTGSGSLFLSQSSTAASPTLHDFAYSGAACDNTLFGAPAPVAAPFSVVQQVQMAQTLISTLNSATTLYVFLPATQDISGQSMTTNNATSISVARCYATQVSLLLSLGARNIIVGNMYPFDLAPQNLGLTPAQRAVIATEVSVLNSALASLLTALVVPAQTHLVQFDMHGLYVNTLIPNANQILYSSTTGAPNTTNACSQNGVANAACAGAGADSYLWWDVHHPTRQTHKYIAISMYTALSNALIVAAAASPGGTLPPVTTGNTGNAGNTGNVNANANSSSNSMTTNIIIGASVGGAVLLFVLIAVIVVKTGICAQRNSKKETVDKRIERATSV